MNTLKIDNGKATLADTSFVVPRPTLAVLCTPFILYAFDFAKKNALKKCAISCEKFLFLATTKTTKVKTRMLRMENKRLCHEMANVKFPTFDILVIRFEIGVTLRLRIF